MKYDRLSTDVLSVKGLRYGLILFDVADGHHDKDSKS